MNDSLFEGTFTVFLKDAVVSKIMVVTSKMDCHSLECETFI